MINLTCIFHLTRNRGKIVTDIKLNERLPGLSTKPWNVWTKESHWERLFNIHSTSHLTVKRNESFDNFIDYITCICMQVEILHDNIIYRLIFQYNPTLNHHTKNSKIPNCEEPTETSHTTQDYSYDFWDWMYAMDCKFIIYAVLTHLFYWSHSRRSLFTWPMFLATCTLIFVHVNRDFCSR